MIQFDGGGLDPKGGRGVGGVAVVWGLVLIPLQAYSSSQGIRN